MPVMPDTRYSPPVHTVRLTETREIAPPWVYIQMIDSCIARRRGKATANECQRRIDWKRIGNEQIAIASDPMKSGAVGWFTGELQLPK